MSGQRMTVGGAFWQRPIAALTWAALAGVHAFACYSVASKLGANSQWAAFIPGLAKLLALSATVIFCLLKFVDVPWLRVKRGWRSAIASLVIVAFLHSNVLSRASDSDISNYQVPIGAAMVSVFLFDTRTIRLSLGRFLLALVAALQARVSRIGRNAIREFEQVLSVATPLRATVAIRAPRPPPFRQ